MKRRAAVELLSEAASSKRISETPEIAQLLQLINSRGIVVGPNGKPSAVKFSMEDTELRSAVERVLGGLPVEQRRVVRQRLNDAMMRSDTLRRRNAGQGG